MVELLLTNLAQGAHVILACLHLLTIAVESLRVVTVGSVLHVSQSEALADQRVVQPSSTALECHAFA